MISLRHRSASGDVSSCWEFDPRTRRIVASMRVGNMRADFSVAICSTEQPELGAHPIKRLDAETWRVLPERYIRTWPDRVERLETIRCPIADAVGYRQLALTNAPPEVVRQLEGLSDG